MIRTSFLFHQAVIFPQNEIPHTRSKDHLSLNPRRGFFLNSFITLHKCHRQHHSTFVGEVNQSTVSASTVKQRVHQTTDILLMMHARRHMVLLLLLNAEWRNLVPVDEDAIYVRVSQSNGDASFKVNKKGRESVKIKQCSKLENRVYSFG